MGAVKTAAHLIATLTKVHAEGRLDDKMKVLTTPLLLIVDETFICPATRASGPGARCSATRDRHRHPRPPAASRRDMNIRGNSVRLKDRPKAGLVRSHEEKTPLKRVGKFERP